ncbi:hypothetical protein, conserved in T. vivax [Trypanosoma vivax Y486]|uniref:Uncharacterized protein n=1 Tax=Trypanosoma vivax (strain Y486) TaxID=1055687 RepID=F9WVS7_TRYVY|nr:hypothetical protein, conserved in T. vivax [Trypanosoma vivax Y486]|eukprot:CCD21687.1 hypothetical protein, conserved in T. vivax [Trypanosoma vivax Y486]
MFLNSIGCICFEKNKTNVRSFFFHSLIPCCFMAVVRVIAQALLDDSQLFEPGVETSATTPVRKFIGVKPVLVKNCRGVTLGRAAVSFKAQATSTAANMIRASCCICFFFLGSF